MFTSSSLQYSLLRFCNHSKYDTVTPPPFARISGITNISFLNKISSASGVVGPLAASATILALIFPAFLFVI
jgi:hypothetical protein